MTTLRRHLHQFVLFIACLVPGASAMALPVPGISKMVVFGDSLSDSGAGIGLSNDVCSSAFLGPLVCGARRNSVTLAPPFFEGKRISDGPTAVEVMNQLMGFAEMRPAYVSPTGKSVTGENFAIFAAKANGTDELSAFIGLSAQVSSFRSQNATVDSQALFVIFIGGNDLIDAISANDPTIVQGALAQIQAQIDALAKIGAKRFLVYKLPNFADLPLYAQAGASTKRVAASYTSAFNTGIDSLHTSVAGQSIYRFDLQSLWAFVKQYAFDRGFDFSDACNTLPDLNSTIQNSKSSDVVIGVDNGGCGSKVTNGLFFEAEHPSGLLHQLIGAASYDFVAEQIGGSCGVHAWGADTLARVGGASARRGLPGSVYSYQNPSSAAGTLDYFRLIGTGSDGAYWYFPTNRQDNGNWQYLGHAAPDTAHCGSNFRSTMNYWTARAVQSSINGGVAAGSFTAAQAGALFFYDDPYTQKTEVFKFLDPNQDGSYWYFPTDGVSSNVWWSRTSPTNW